MSGVRALLFDVFGTVVDWRSSVIAKGEAVGKRHRVEIPWPEFADAWRREGYSQAIAQINLGEAPRQDVDVLHRAMLDRLLARYGLDLPEDEVVDLNMVWHRLWPWPDSPSGLTRLKRRYTISTLSNGDLHLLTNMAKNGALPWDCILAAELFGAYKPDPRVYDGAARLLRCAPEECMMVAAHEQDLQAARARGFHTAFVHRPREFGPGVVVPRPADGTYDFVVANFTDLADRLGV
ncbi:MAG: haloacid dehalogenase type II [Chloroflexi bacterium]|nr:haloacid dehalogenase type II [Chloroflexota bacterium]